jgi:hypothetical protein
MEAVHIKNTPRDSTYILKVEVEVEVEVHMNAGRMIIQK